MGKVIDLTGWRRLRKTHGGARVEDRVDGSVSGAGERAKVDRLDRAVRRIEDMARGSLPRGSQAEREVETELLAIIGQLSMGLVDEACGRAERLAKRLTQPDGRLERGS